LAVKAVAVHGDGALNAEDTEDTGNVTASDLAVQQSRAVVVLGVLGVESGCRR
jgi:hypothetical protein